MVAPNRLIGLGCPTCVYGAGHVAMIAVTGGKATYYSFAPVNGDSGAEIITPGQLDQRPLEDVDVTDTTALINWVNKNVRDPFKLPHYTQAAEFDVTPEAVKSAEKRAKDYDGNYYSVYTHNCLDMVSDAFADAGIVGVQNAPRVMALLPGLGLYTVASNIPNVFIARLQGRANRRWEFPSNF